MSNKFSIFNVSAKGEARHCRQFSKLICFWIVGLFLATSVLAANATPSGIPQDQIKEKIKERLEKVVSEGLDKVKGIMEKNQPVKYYAFIGSIKTISESQLSVITPTGEKKVTVASDAAIIKVTAGKEKMNLKIKELEVDQYLIVIGLKKNDDELLGKRIIVTTQPTAAIKRKIVVGKVTEIDSKKVVIKTTNEELSLATDDKTSIKIIGLTKSNLDKVQIGDNLTAIVALDKEGNVDKVKAILIVPGKANPAAKENEIEGTPSATPKKTNESSPKASSQS